jgi:hypothetical protein
VNWNSILPVYYRLGYRPCLITVKLVRITEICSNVTFSIVRAGKYLCAVFPVWKGVKQEDFLPFLLKLSAD